MGIKNRCGSHIIGPGAIALALLGGHSFAGSSFYSVQSFGPDDLTSADAAMPGATIEDFEDTSLIAQAEFSLIGTPTAGKLRNDNVPATWDGEYGYSNSIQMTGDDGYSFCIEIPDGAAFVGVGLSHLSFHGMRVFVNDELVVADVLNLPFFVEDQPNRNGYLILSTAEGGPSIRKIVLKSMAPLNNDYIEIDHVAIGPVTETLDVTFPDTLTIYAHGDPCSVFWSPGEAGTTVTPLLYDGPTFLDLYHSTTANDGDANRASLPSSWGAGSRFRVKVEHENGVDFGWSAEFTILCKRSDLDADGGVGSSDLALLIGSWGPCPSFSIPCLPDLDGDGAVGSSDLAQLLGEWGPCD